VALDLLNTQNGTAGEPPTDDVLHDYGDLLAWSQKIGALSEVEAERLVRSSRRDPDAASAAFERMRTTREYMYALFSAVARGVPPPERAVARLQRDEADALSHAEIVAADGGYAWSWSHDEDMARPLWPIIHAALTLLVDGPLDRVKGCAACRFHFLDESKNRSRRWCSMDDCGTADKMRKYVARRATARSAVREV